MELKLFTDLIDALGKVAGGLKALVNLPKAERETMRRTLDETYRLIDTALNMVTIRVRVRRKDARNHCLNEREGVENRTWGDRCVPRQRKWSITC